MAGHRRKGSTLWLWAKRLGPVLISAGLVTWLVWKVTPQKLARAAATPATFWLIVATLVQLVFLFLWDTFSLWWLFSQPDDPLPPRLVLRARTDSALWSAFSLEIGQGAFAWTLARARHTSLGEALGRCLLLGLFDFGTLQSLALLGSFLHTLPLHNVLRWIPVGSVGGLVLLVILLRVMPSSWRQWLEGKDWASWLKWWTWKHSLMLWAQRLVMFLLVLVYAGVCLLICGMPAGARVLVGVIPFVLIAESLPGTAGLGERETALVYLLAPEAGDQRAKLLSFGLTWSLVVILGRLAIGLLSRWLPRTSARQLHAQQHNGTEEAAHEGLTSAPSNR